MAQKKTAHTTKEKSSNKKELEELKADDELESVVRQHVAALDGRLVQLGLTVQVERGGPQTLDSLAA